MKKGQLPEGVLILLVVAICGMSLYYAATYSSVKAEAISLDSAFALSNEDMKFEIYVQQAANLASQQAFADVAKKPVSCNQQAGTAEVWSSSCRPTESVAKELFKQKFDAKLSELTGKAFTSEINDKITVRFEPTIIKANQKNRFFEYNISREYSPEIEIDYAYIAFDNIYQKVFEKKADCESKFPESDTKMASVRDCMKDMSFDGMEFEISISGKYYLFSLNTLKYYIYDGKFYPAEMKFAI